MSTEHDGSTSDEAVTIVQIPGTKPSRVDRRTFGRAAWTAVTAAAAAELGEGARQVSNEVTLAQLRAENAQLQQELQAAGRPAAELVNGIRKKDFEDGITMLFNAFVGDKDGLGHAMDYFSIDTAGIATIEKQLQNGKSASRLETYTAIQPTTRVIVAERYPHKDDQWRLKLQLMLAYIGSTTAIVADNQSDQAFDPADFALQYGQILNTTYGLKLQDKAETIRSDFLNQLLSNTPVYIPES